MVGDDPVDDREPEPGAAARMLGREIRCKYFVFEVARDTRAVVLDDQQRAVTGLASAGRDRNVAITALADRVTRILHQVEHHLVQLVLVRVDLREWLELDLER